MYLSYDEYVEYGGTLEETAFEQFEFEARSIIDWWTFNRLQHETVYPEAVKRCMFKILSLLTEKQSAMVLDTSNSDGVVTITAGITSQSNDGVRTDYNTLSASDALDAVQDEIQEAIQLYLGSVRNSLGHRVLYRGIYPDE